MAKPLQMRPPTDGTLELIQRHGVHAYAPDGYSADDLPLFAILRDPNLTALPVRDVRGLLTRGLVVEVWEDEFPLSLVLSDAGRRLLMSEVPA